MKKIPYGISNYEELITEGYYYVDKTSYLKALEDIETVWYLRPRRFGKTLFTSMMFYYYDIKSKDKFDTLFKDTDIYIEPTSLRNSYYVLRLDFSKMSAIDSNDLNDMKYRFKNCVLSALTEFKRYYQVDFKINEQDESADIIMQFFDTVDVDAKIYVIIDEYDNFTNSILENDAEIFRQILGKNGFVKDFYSRIKKARNTIVDRVFVTGVCSISVDASDLGFNIATDLTNDVEFNAMTALTHEEVRVLISDIDSSGQDEIFDVMFKYYDGYKFSEETNNRVFNPTLVMYYLKYYYTNGNAPKKLFDKNIISNYEQISNLIKLQHNTNYNDVIKEIYTNRIIEAKLKGNFDLSKTVLRDDVISLLYYFGYLTIEGANENKMLFTIPNRVISDVIDDYFNNLMDENNIIINTEVLYNAIEEMASTGKINTLNKLVVNTLEESSNRLLMNFDEKYVQLMYRIKSRLLNLMQIIS